MQVCVLRTKDDNDLFIFNVHYFTTKNIDQKFFTINSVMILLHLYLVYFPLVHCTRVILPNLKL